MTSVKDIVGFPATLFARHQVSKVILDEEDWFMPKLLASSNQSFYPRRLLGRGGEGIVVEYNNEFSSFALKVIVDTEGKSTDTWLANLTRSHRKSLKRYILEQKPIGSYQQFNYVVMEQMDLELSELKDRLALSTFKFALPKPSVRFDILYKVCIAFRGIHAAGLSYMDAKLSNVMCNVRESFSGHLLVAEVKIIDLDGMVCSEGVGPTAPATFPPVETWPLESSIPDAFPDASDCPCTPQANAWVFGVFVLRWLCPHTACYGDLSLLGYEHLDASGIWVVPREHSDTELARRLLERVKDLFKSEAFPNMRPSELKTLQDIFDPNGDPRLRSSGAEVVVRPGLQAVLKVLMGYLQRIKLSSILQRAWFTFRGDRN